MWQQTAFGHARITEIVTTVRRSKAPTTGRAK